VLEFECADCDPSDGKIDLLDFSRYVKCRCGRKLGMGCCDRFQATIQAMWAKLTPGGVVDDPYHLWEAFERGIHRDARVAFEYPQLFLPATALKPALLQRCFFCEDADVGEAPARMDDSLKQAEPDIDPLITVLLPVRRKDASGVDMDTEELREITLLFAWPVVHSEACGPRFKGGVGTLDEVGGARRAASFPPLPLPTCAHCTHARAHLSRLPLLSHARSQRWGCITRRRPPSGRCRACSSGGAIRCEADGS
jgi:hypothetical protein